MLHRGGGYRVKFKLTHYRKHCISPEVENNRVQTPVLDIFTIGNA